MKRLFIMRQDLHMSTGKLAAQVGHCAEAYWTNMFRRTPEVHSVDGEGNESVAFLVELPFDIYSEYICGIFTKVICGAVNKNHVMKAKKTADKMGLVEGVDYGLIYDKCLTELTPEEDDGTTLTGIWFKPLTDEQAYKISRGFMLYQ